MKKKREKRELKNKKTNFFADNYKKSWNYVKESKKFIWAVIVLFFVSTLLGFLFQPEAVSNFIWDYVNKTLEKIDGMSSSQMVFFILLNNLQVGFMGIIYGFVLGIFPIASTFLNGYVLGFVSSYAISSSGGWSLLNLVPHGIFELPAIFISFGLGIKFGTFIFYKNKMEKFGTFFLESLRVFVFIVVPLLVIAAIIEGSLIYFLN